MIYIKGEHNVVVDALLRLDMEAKVQLKKVGGRKLPEFFLNRRFCANLSNEFPLRWKQLADEQEKDAKLQEKAEDDPKFYSKQEFLPNVQLWTVRSKYTNEWRIVKY